MADFQYKTGGTWTDVPDAAHPDDEGGSVLVEYPAAGDFDGSGNPAGAFGLPELVVKASFMTGTGMVWWVAFFAAATAETASISITGYNPRTAAWEKFAGTLWRPRAQCQPGATVARTIYRNVEIRIRNLTITT